MRQILIIALLSFGVSGGLSCAGHTALKPNVEADLRALEALHANQRAAHLGKQAELLVGMFTEPLLQIKDGEIREVSREAGLRRTKAYFAGADFLEWDDIAKPKIRISDDGTMAYVLVQKRVRLLSDDDGDGQLIEEHTVFAWMEAWEKIDGTWKLAAVASTEKNGIEESLRHQAPSIEAGHSIPTNVGARP